MTAPGCGDPVGRAYSPCEMKLQGETNGSASKLHATARHCPKASTFQYAIRNFAVVTINQRGQMAPAVGATGHVGEVERPGKLQDFTRFAHR